MIVIVCVFSDSDCDVQQIRKATERYDEWVARLGYKWVENHSIHKSRAKQLKVSGDALMQVALQLGHHSLHGEMVPTYESANHAAFKHGRTECIRSATAEVG